MDVSHLKEVVLILHIEMVAGTTSPAFSYTNKNDDEFGPRRLMLPYPLKELRVSPSRYTKKIKYTGMSKETTKFTDSTKVNLAFW